jgi:hypothetical protein
VHSRLISYATTDCGVCPSTPRTLVTFQELERTRTKEGGREILDTFRLVAIDRRLGHRLVRGRRFEARDTFSRLISFTCFFLYVPRSHGPLFEFIGSNLLTRMATDKTERESGAKQSALTDTALVT